MQVWRQIDPVGAKNFQGGVIVIGNFDGLHLGHQALLAAANRHPGPRTVITFDPHPVQVLRPDQGLRRLLPREDLEEHLPGYSIDLLLILPFTKAFAQLSPDDFLTTYLNPFTPRWVVAGYDFAFGRDRQGSLQRMREWALGLGAEVETLPALEKGGAIVSSRRVRELVTQGLVAEAASLLGRPFYVRGRVIKGAGRGVGLGFPTLNQEPVNEILPAFGVYATRTRWRGKSWPSITNIGTNPTFESGQAVKVETHVLDGDPNLADESLDVDFVQFIRPERKFQSSVDLANQIRSDILKAKSILGVA